MPVERSSDIPNPAVGFIVVRWKAPYSKVFRYNSPDKKIRLPGEVARCPMDRMARTLLPFKIADCIADSGIAQEAYLEMNHTDAVPERRDFLRRRML